MVAPVGRAPVERSCSGFVVVERSWFWVSSLHALWCSGTGGFAHEGEHGFGGGEEFGVGYVADDFGFADAGGRTKERVPLRFFLSLEVRATSFSAVALKGGSGP